MEYLIDDSVGYGGDRHRIFRDLLVVGTKLNTQVGCNVPRVGVVFHTNIVNFVLVIINTCRCVKMCSVEKLEL